MFIKEKNLDFTLPQMEISAGMFRAIATVIILNYFLKMKKSCTLIIDDIGEGLDYQRTSNLINLVLKKIQNQNVQIIMTSNNHFLLNAVDTKYWNILDREKGKVKAFNYNNSKLRFEEFSMIGLNNFEFFRGNMYKEEDQ